MRIIDILNSSSCQKIFLEIQEFVRISLSEYNDAIEKEGFCYSDKDIFDFVWGTVNFSSSEICVLDSPLLQRLRRIHHLGLASSVYCNADSSRFSHTIGVTEVADRMAKTIKSRLNMTTGENQERIYDIREVVRLAAIFHDVGHMFFSHVSEQYFAFDKSFPRYEEVLSAKNFFCERTSSNIALHELFSVMIVNSSETLRLFKLIAPHMLKSRLVQKEHFEQLAEYVSCLIIGIPVDKFILPYSSIINSSIDADKLDYLSRDSACTKVPIAVDIARIIQKLDVVNIKEIEQPSIWNDTTSDAVPLKIMAIKSSAKKVFWQLSNARSNMFESVYYHHKVLTAESMFRKMLKKLYQIKDEENQSFTKIMQLTDDVFNEYWDLVWVKPELRDTDEAAEASKLIKNIRERNLYKRVASFSRNSFSGSLSSIKIFFNQVIQDSSSDKYKLFCSLMNEEYNKICDLLGIESSTTEAIDYMFVFSKYDAMSSMPIESGDGFCIWSSSLMKQETMEAGKKSQQEQFYLLTNCKNRKLIYLALEKVLTKFGIEQLARDSAICSKVPYEEMNKIRMRLLELGYYNNTLYLLQDENFTRLLDKKILKTIIEKYRSFLGVNSCRITEERLIGFLRQFLWLELDKNELVLLLDGILKLLAGAYYLDRDSFSNEVDKLITELSVLQYNYKHIVTLGGLFDSAKHLMYYFNDVKSGANMAFDSSLESALKNITENDCLCFFDDGAYSGKQVISIFQELMGVPADERTTNEHHVDELSPENKEKIKNTNIVLAYLCFNKESEDYIRGELEKLGIKELRILFVKDLSKKIFDGNNTTFSNEQQKSTVKKWLSEIGYTILLSSKKQINGEFKSRWNENRIKEASLGYNDAQQFVVFSTNIPTYSITAFWANGDYKTHKWTGLFQRTVKD